MPTVSFTFEISDPGFSNPVEPDGLSDLVFLNGQSGERKSVPFEDGASANLEPGNWTLTLQDTQSVANHTQVLTVGDEDMEVGLSLVSYDGLMEISVDGAVIVDGDEIGPEMYGGYRLPPGTFTVTTDDPDHAGKSLTVEISSGESTDAGF